MKLIKINTDHYIIVDENKDIEENCFTYKNGEIIEVSYLMQDNGDKITHSTQPESLGMGWMQSVLPLLLSEVKELIGEVDVEQYAWDNPVLSRKDVYELFNNVFKDRIIEGAYRISASKQVYQFDTKLRELAKQKALEDNKEKKYTERDLWRAFDSGKAGKLAVEFYETLFQPKTEWEVEFIDGKLKLK